LDAVAAEPERQGLWALPLTESRGLTVKTILETNGVTKRFGGLVALDDISICVQEGEIYGLIGPNGAGKTTFLNVIAGAYRPESGHVHFLGKDITGLSAERTCREGIARTFQISRPFAKMTTIENVMVSAIFGNRTPVTDPRARAEEALAYVEFPMPSNTPAANLNTAQLKRLDLARALASNPTLLLLDEPAAGLTPSELALFMELVRKIRDRGITVMVIEHLMRMIKKTCDRVCVLQYGKQIAVGTPAEISNDKRVIDAYLGQESLI